MDIPPEAIQHVVESYLGGTGKFFGRGYDTFGLTIVRFQTIVKLYVLFGLRKMQSEDRHQIYSLNIRSEDSIRYAQESKTDPIANYTDSKPSPNSSITEPEDSGKTDKRWSLKAATPGYCSQVIL